MLSASERTEPRTCFAMAPSLTHPYTPLPILTIPYPSLPSLTRPYPPLPTLTVPYPVYRFCSFASLEHTNRLILMPG